MTRTIVFALTLTSAVLVARCAAPIVSDHAVPQATVAVGPAGPDEGAARLRKEFLHRWARGYFPGRTGDLLVVPREGEIITLKAPDIGYMHGTPWPYDTHIPLLLHGPGVIRAGIYAQPARQQDVAPTLSAILGVNPPPTASGRVLIEALPSRIEPPAAVALIVLDGMRIDYFDRYADVLPTLSRLRREGAWFSSAGIDYLPTNTAVGHATISTGADPSVHGITGNSLPDDVNVQHFESLAGWSPRDLMALTLSDVWNLRTGGRAVIIAQGSSVPATTALAGHGRCLLNGRVITVAGYESRSGHWKTNDECYRIPDYLAGLDAARLWGPDGTWMSHPIADTVGVRRSGLFPSFEADALTAMLSREPIGEDDVPDLVLANLKGADFVGHKHGPDSPELRATMVEIDRSVKRILDVLESKTKGRLVVALTADHGLSDEPAVPERRHYTVDIVALLHDRFDPDERRLVTSFAPEDSQIFVDDARAAALGVSPNTMARFLEQQPFIFAAYTNDAVREAAP